MHSLAAVVQEAVIWAVCASVLILIVALFAFNVTARIFGAHHAGPLSAAVIGMAAGLGAFLLFNMVWPVQGLLH
ncbi:MAG: hypothetical protein NVSMB65_21420 [Chloroflexota bacterium]